MKKNNKLIKTNTNKKITNNNTNNNENKFDRISNPDTQSINENNVNIRKMKGIFNESNTSFRFCNYLLKVHLVSNKVYNKLYISESPIHQTR